MVAARGPCESVVIANNHTIIIVKVLSLRPCGRYVSVVNYNGFTIHKWYTYENMLFNAHRMETLIIYV